MKLIPILLTASASFLIFACSKDKFQTTPTIEIADYNTREVTQGRDLNIRLNYFDKEGDLNEGILTAIIRRQNLLPLPDDRNKADTLNYTLPDFPPRDKGEITFRITYDYLKESAIENDTILIRFNVTDRAGNTSDSILSDRIVIYLP